MCGFRAREIFEVALGGYWYWLADMEIENLSKRIVLFPFFNSESSQLTQMKNSWTKARTEKRGRYVDSETNKVGRIKNGVVDPVERYRFFGYKRSLERFKVTLSKMVSGEDVIYICGHCGPGVSYLASTELGKEKISAEQLAKSLGKV